ncbi:MAG: PepSY domain-containing protein [Gemmatimonadota bacterium]
MSDANDDMGRPGGASRRDACRGPTAEAEDSRSKARATALARVPNGTIKSYELEREGGRLIYSYDIAVKGKPGIEEVNVDAMTGEVVGTQHEDAAAERAQAAAEKQAPAEREGEEQEQEEEQAGHVKTPPAPYAQWLVDRSVSAHGPVKSVEMAVVLDGVCRTIAATAPEDLGETCDADERQPMETGTPNVEAPSQADPVYDVTLALHDVKGTLIGAVGMDIEPGDMDRAGVLSLARSVLAEIEQQIPSKQRLFQAAP